MLLSGAELGAIAVAVPEVASFFRTTAPATPTMVKRMIDKIMRLPNAPAEPNRLKLQHMINHLNAERQGITLH